MNKYITIFFILFINLSCTDTNKHSENHTCSPESMKRFTPELLAAQNNKLNVPNKNGMVLIIGNSFQMGGDVTYSNQDELPKHKVEINSFWMDETEVTNAQFEEFVEATGYITTAEIKPDWEELKKSLPINTPKPDESLLVPASLVFRKNINTVSLNDPSQWWEWVPGANWRNPGGPGTSIENIKNHPVIHVSWFDAVAYSKWKGRRLPTEAEWEFASRGGLINKNYSWGEEDNLSQMANTWEGDFPRFNLSTDGYELTSPVKTYPPNNYGLYDMSGNVWEWCSDLYNFSYYKSISDITSINPKGPEKSFDPNEPYSEKRVLRGGSFMCNKSYCTGYRNSMRMKSTPDTGSMHTGFRTVMSYNE